MSYATKDDAIHYEIAAYIIESGCEVTEYDVDGIFADCFEYDPKVMGFVCKVDGDGWVDSFIRNRREE